MLYELMSKTVPKKEMDITGVEITPGYPNECLGNGEQGFECCCDECDYYLLCFPEFWQREENPAGEEDFRIELSGN